MAEKKATTATRNASKGAGLSAAERAAMKERVAELKSEGRRGKRDRRAEGEADLLAKVAEMPKSDRVMAERLHAMVSATAPELEPKTWYGMPAWAKDGKVVCFFQAADKFKARYATFGFNGEARIDDGSMWATSFALKRLTPADEAKLRKLVKKAVT